MFGTGVDISRAGLMVVHGQPKTTSTYIQSTGRVGRKRGALVVVFYRATRPRDLSHYEIFCGYHRSLHKFVEPVSVTPFSPGTLDRGIGPVVTGILRNMRGTAIDWHRDVSASEMADRRFENEVVQHSALFERRSQLQPPAMRPQNGHVQQFTDSELDRWQQIAQQNRDNLRYVEYHRVESPVVLGDPSHQHRRLPVVYENAPSSLREIEEETVFETR
jgi:hypothetical protein